jgi:hypothetical protein
MLTEEQAARLFGKSASLVLLDGFDPESQTLQGPFACVGDCISDCCVLSAAYVDALSTRAGDLGIWFMPSQPEGEQYACKWLVQDSAGRGWLACKYFAVRYRPDFHKAAGRVVAIVNGEPGAFDEPLSKRLAAEMTQLRASPPLRDDVVVFVEDLLDIASIVAEIDRRHQMS